MSGGGAVPRAARVRFKPRAAAVLGAGYTFKSKPRFHRFSDTGGKQKTETQFFLLAFAFNIKKLWNRTLDERLGIDLFKKEAA